MSYIMIVSCIIVIVAIAAIGIFLFTSQQSINASPVKNERRPRSSLSRVEQLIKDYGSNSDTKETFENTNETAPSPEILELYERMIKILPKSIKDNLECDTATTQRNHMYNVVKCIVGKLSWWHATSPEKTELEPGKFDEFLVILVWIIFMIEYDINNVTEILIYEQPIIEQEQTPMIEPQVSETTERVETYKNVSSGSIKIVHPQFKAFLENILVDLKDPTKSIAITELGGEELVERIVSGLAVNTIMINDFVALILQFSERGTVGGEDTFQAKCRCNL